MRLLEGCEGRDLWTWDERLGEKKRGVETRSRAVGRHAVQRPWKRAPPVQPVVYSSGVRLDRNNKQLRVFCSTFNTAITVITPRRLSPS
jgi:hypothetical protein